MYKITWDKDTRGVLLNNNITKDTLGYSPRPVFYEELDLLGLNKLGLKYPKSQEPLLWAINKQYYYEGNLIFEARGANIYDNAIIKLEDWAKGITLQPTNITEMLRKNSDFIFLLENEAIEFIRDIYTTYSKVNKTYSKSESNQIDFDSLVAKVEKKTRKKMAVVKEDCDSFDIMPLDSAKESGKQILHSTKIDKFIASFSGGKDSQVVLDLCTRAIPPSEFEVIYSDTGYELPPSLSLYEEIKEYYNELFPALKFTTAKNHESVLKYWDQIGTPSDTHRWCCTVMKTAPLYRHFKTKDNKQAKILTFDGVRAEESVRRSSYNRIGKGVKHSTVINASPILYWNAVEIFLYLFKHKLPINPAYRQGMTRVGCLICPFSSEWNDMIVNHIYKKELSPFLSKIENNIAKLKLSDPKDYIKEGKWKRRAGGRDMRTKISVNIISHSPHLIIDIKNPNKNILTWLFAVCPYTLDKNGGELFYKNNVYNFEVIERKEKEFRVSFYDTNKEILLQGLIKRAIYKAAFCINCEACEVECPTGALSILPEAKINKSRCVHCHKCLNFHEMGCIVAHSLKITTQNENNMKLVGYNNFGLNEEWLDFFFKNSDTYFENNDHGLNPNEQLPNFVKWLVHAEILNDTKEKKLTKLGVLLQQLYENQPTLVWEIIWINLSYNSPIAKWYSEKVEFNSEFTETGLRELLKNDYPSNSDTSLKNILYALFRTFRESPIGEDINLLIKQDRLTYMRKTYDDLSREAIAYSLYKYAEKRNISNLRVSELYSSNTEDGLYKQFGLKRSLLEKSLRSLSSDSNRVIIAELNMGLDHITLREDLNPTSALQNLIQ